VSLDSLNLERSTLERKDRAELATIAETLGRKPTSRAKKSEIVDLILELTGVTSNGGGLEPVAPSPSSARAASASEAGSVSGDAHRASSPSEVATAQPPTVSGETSTTPSSAETSSTEVPGDTGDGGERGEQAAPAGQAPEGQVQDRHAPGAPSSESPSEESQPQGTQVGPPVGEAEPGNRRRRRRGRNRDRGGEPQGGEEVPWDGEPVEVEGLLDLRDEGYGFLRVKGYLPSRDDVYVSVKQCRQLGLRRGDHIKGASRPAGRQEKNPALLRVDLVNGMDPEHARRRPRFEDLTPLFPDEKLRLENPDNPLDMTSRIIDLIAPIGKGQRGLIVSPPKAGKTTIIKTIAQSIERNNPEVHLIVLQVDERPEEVTDMRRSVQGEVVASTFDRPSDEHTAVAELTIERAKRLVEYGQDVVIILDGITRLSRAYNLAAPATGRIMSGGIDTGALYPPKKFFGAARNVEEGGSLTILATALVETGSKMDEVIFEEFKGTGNMELRLDRRMAERRVYPAIDVDASSTRHEELLFERSQLNQVWKLRRVLSGLAAEGNAGASLELLIDRMKTFPTNDMFLAEIAKAPGGPTS
jgi:transcription termination factor Rho